MASIGTGLSALPMVWPPMASSHSRPCRPMAATAWPSSLTSTAWFCTCCWAFRRRNGRLAWCFLRLSRLALDNLDMGV
ncbi:hypothetical protein D3C73_1590760 [compost metagenome]